MSALAAARPVSAQTAEEGEPGVSEVELQKLHRQFRTMEMERKTMAEESKITITKQRLSIEKLRKEYEQLYDECSILTQSGEHASAGREDAMKQEQLMQQGEIYKKMIKQTAQEIHNLEQQLIDADKELNIARNAVPGTLDISPKGIEKQIRALENRLDKAVVKYNKAITGNKNIRLQVDMLRRERVLFDNVFRRYEKELQDHKKQMNEIIEFSNSAYDTRDEAQTKVIALREKAEKESQSYQGELRELDRILEQDRKLKDFMSVKQAEREPMNIIPPKRPKRDQTRNIRNSSDGLSDSVENYETFLSQLRALTQIEDVHEIVKRFTTVDDQNFSLFNYVNEVNKDIEKLQEEIAELDKDISSIRNEGSNADETRQSRLRSIEEQLALSEAQTSQLESKESHINETTNEVQKQLLSLFKTLYPDQELPSSEPGAADGSSVDLMSILSAIEHRTSDILMKNMLLSQPKAQKTNPDGRETKEDNTNNSSLFNTNSAQGAGPVAPVTLNIIAPSTGDDVDDDGASEDEDRLLTREELVQRTLKGLTKREKSGAVGQKMKPNRRRSPTRTQGDRKNTNDQ